MKKHRFSDQPWYPYAVAACIAVAFHALLTHFGTVLGAVRTFTGYFSSLLLGCVLAYLMNPLAKLYQKKLFRGVRQERLRWTLSVALALLSVLLLLLFLLGTLIPQLADSVFTLVDNLDDYLASLQALLDKWGLAETLNLSHLLSSSEDIVKKLGSFLSENIQSVLSVSATAGRSLVKWLIALILSVYLLSSKEGLRAGASRLLRLLLNDRRYDKMAGFLARCDEILVRYVVFSLLDAAIVGVLNAIFMSVLGMQYVGLVSLLVAVTNLIPTFGPVIGAVIGGFVLLLVNPLHALEFIIFTLVLQFFDGYIIKPRLFGNSLGVSGLLILVSVVVCGNMFGIVGILLSIPLAAIVDFLYRDYLLPALERRHARTK